MCRYLTCGAQRPGNFVTPMDPTDVIYFIARSVRRAIPNAEASGRAAGCLVDRLSSHLKLGRDINYCLGKLEGKPVCAIRNKILQFFCLSIFVSKRMLQYARRNWSPKAIGFSGIFRFFVHFGDHFRKSILFNSIISGFFYHLYYLSNPYMHFAQFLFFLRVVYR